MECANYREALSARIDGENEPIPPATTDKHLRDCADCQQWHHHATNLTRTLRVRQATPLPDLTHTILHNTPTLTHARDWWPRITLGGIGVAQIGLALTQLFGLTTTATHAHHNTTPVASHLFNEGTAWNLALGIGLFWAAFHPRATSGLIPVLTGFVTVLLAYSTHDLLAGTAPITRVAGHSLLAAGLALLVLVNRRHPHDTHPADTTNSDTHLHTNQPATQTQPTTELHHEPGRPPLRPASRHQAA